MDIPCPVVDQDEIVSCAVHFGETQHGMRLTQQSVAGNPACGFLAIQTGLLSPGIARSRFDDYLSRLEATSGLGFSGDSCIARIVRGRLQQLDP
jgi:hypothetical protein